MTIHELQRAALVLFAAREAIDTNSMQTLKAICLVIRNRVKAGWHDANWLTIIEHADNVAGNMPRAAPKLDLNSKALQLLCRDIDSIYHGTAQDELQDAIGDPKDKKTRPALYYHFIDRPINPWFHEHIINDRKNHPVRARVHPIVFFE